MEASVDHRFGRERCPCFFSRRCTIHRRRRRANQGRFPPTLRSTGLAYLAQSRPAERDAIEFVRSEVARDSTILEAVGEWFEFGLISRSTGVSTVFNWPGHEIQWRGSAASFDGREQDVADIYQSVDWAEAENLLARYDVEYVYVDLEKGRSTGPKVLRNSQNTWSRAFRETT